MVKTIFDNLVSLNLNQTEEISLDISLYSKIRVYYNPYPLINDDFASSGYISAATILLSIRDNNIGTFALDIFEISSNARAGNVTGVGLTMPKQDILYDIPGTNLIITMSAGKFLPFDVDRPEGPTMPMTVGLLIYGLYETDEVKKPLSI